MSPAGRVVMTMHQNEEKGNRAAAAVVFALAGAAIAWCASGGVSGRTALYGPGTVKATSSVAAMEEEPEPVVWYEDDGLYIYQPGRQEKTKLTGLKDGGMDRMTLFFSEKNPADLTLVLPDRTGAYYLKDLTTDYIGVTRGDLWYSTIPGKGKQPEEMPVAEKVLSSRLLPDGSLVWLDDNTSFWILSGTPGEKGTEPRKIAAGVKEYYISSEEPEVFLVCESGKAYYFRKDTGKQVVAEGVKTVDHVSDDLRKIYYRTENKDLFYEEVPGLPQVIDVDVEEVAVVKKTGSIYYLKENRENEPVPSGTQTGLPPADKTELTPEEEELVDLRIEELLQQLGGGAGEDGTEEQAAETGAAPASGYQLNYFDGTAHRGLLKGVSGVDTNHLDELENDRAIVYTGEAYGHGVWLMMGAKPLYTGLSAADEGLMDLCPDAVRDVLYVSRQREDQIGSPDQGGIYAMHYTEKGFTNPEPLFAGAVIISAARDGKVYAGTYPLPDEGSTLIVDGEKISPHVASFFWDENGVSEDLQIYRNVFYQDYYVSGDVAAWSKEGGIRPVAYNVREYHGFKDGSFTMLCDYDEDEMKGTLVYWDGKGDPEVLSGQAAGTRAGDGEK